MRLFGRKGQKPKRTPEPIRSVTVHVSGPGVAHVDSMELIRSEKVGRLLDRMDEVFAEEKRRRSKQTKQPKGKRK